MNMENLPKRKGLANKILSVGAGLLLAHSVAEAQLPTNSKDIKSKTLTTKTESPAAASIEFGPTLIEESLKSIFQKMIEGQTSATVESLDVKGDGAVLKIMAKLKGEKRTVEYFGDLMIKEGKFVLENSKLLNLPWGTEPFVRAALNAKLPAAMQALKSYLEGKSKSTNPNHIDRFAIVGDNLKAFFK